jgi:lipopolysaccharide biosynthesis glycosyltransferase
MIRLTIGFDSREAVVYHTFCQSLIDTASEPLSIVPLAANLLGKHARAKSDGSNAFTYSRFLTPYLFDFNGWAIFADGDMISRTDIARLWALRDESKAVLCAKHDYKTKAKVKYLGSKNEDYPRKNWSSVVLWNCGHPKNRILTPEFVAEQTGAFLHRFVWLEDDLVGELPLTWNWLTTEYPINEDADLLHYTLGSPCFEEYRSADMANHWLHSQKRSQEGME